MSPPDFPAPRRLAALDAARVLATFAIVWVHVAESHGQARGWPALGRFGTSFYVIVAAFFVVQSAATSRRRSWASLVRNRAQRLLRPFLIWSLLYGAYYGARGTSLGYNWDGISRWWGPLAGTAVHLWFLPFVFFWGALAALAAPRLLTARRGWVVMGGAGVCLALYWFSYTWLHFAVSRPWLWEHRLHRLDRWIVEVPLFITATWAAVVFHRLGARSRARLKHHPVPIAALGITGFVATEAVYHTQIVFLTESTSTDGRFMANLVAFFLLLSFAGLHQSSAVQRLAPLGRYTYVAFLAHMFFVEFLRSPVKALPGYTTLWFSLAESLLVFFASLGLSWLVAQKSTLKMLRA